MANAHKWLLTVRLDAKCEGDGCISELYYKIAPNFPFSSINYIHLKSFEHLDKHVNALQFKSSCGINFVQHYGLSTVIFNLGLFPSPSFNTQTTETKKYYC